MRPFRLLLPMLVLIGFLVACGGNSKSTLKSIAITPDPGSVTIPLGATQQFTATGTYSDGKTQDITSQVTWASSDTTVISISSGGLATGLKLGTASISASSGTVSSPAGGASTVGDPVIASIAVSPNPGSVQVGGTLQFGALATLTDGSTQDISATATWNSSNTVVATIDSSGLADGLAQGTSNITAAAAGLNGTVTSPASVLTVTAVLVSIDVEPTSPSVPLGETQQFTATGNYNDGSSADLTTAATWASSKTNVATIDAAGLATTHAKGNTNITATLGAVVSNTAVLTVTNPVLQSIAVTPPNPSISVGDTEQFTATGTYSDGSTKDLTGSASWSSSNTAVATIAAGGLATGVGAGSTTITATDVPSSISGHTTLTVGSSNHDALLTGTYTFGFQAPGSLAGTEPFVAGVFTADGAGNITNGILDLNPGGGGVFSSGITFTGTYDIGTDNRGTIDLTGTVPGGVAYTFSGVLAVVSSSKAYVMETDGNGLGYGDINLNGAGPFGNSSVNGPYVVAMGVAGDGFVGQWTADGAGHLNNGIVDANLGGDITNATMSGTYDVTDSARGRGTATVTVNTSPQSVFNFQIYVGAGNLLMISTDTTASFRAVANPQTGGPFSNSSLNGDYVLTGGSDLDTFGGQFTANGSGSWANGKLDLFDSSNGTNFGVPFTATYGVTDGTRGRFTAVESPQGGSTDNIVFYTVSNNRAVLLDLDSGEGTLGEFRKSTAGPYNKASLNGSYSFVLQGCPLTGNDCTGEYTQTGVFTADGNGNVTISFDTNIDGTVSTQTLISGSYVVGDSGSDGGLITTSAGKFRFYFIDTTHLYLEDGATSPTRRVIGEAVKQN